MRIAWVYTRRFVPLMHTISSVKMFDSRAQATMSGINPRLSASASRPVKQAWLYSCGSAAESQAVQSVLLFHKADTELKNGSVYMVVTEGFFIVDIRLIKRAETNYTESVSPEVVAKARPFGIRWRKIIKQKKQ